MVKGYFGLTEEEVIKSREKHGENVHKKEKKKGIVRRFFENLSDPIIKILLAALALEVIFTLGRCNLYEVFGIVAAILIATVVSTVSEYGSERAFAKIEEETSFGRVRVIRNGQRIEISASQLVVGDLMLLSGGERVYADGEIVEGSLKADQSALNGENVEAEKRVGKNDGWSLVNASKVFCGSVITEGEGIVRVLRVGGETYYGMVAKDVQTETRVSPLKLRLTRLASQISKIGYVVAGLVGFTYLFNSILVENHFKIDGILSTLKDFPLMFGILTEALTLMITVIVVAVPEGLPMMITVVLSANMKRMMRDNILVKKMVGIETAGSLNILFTDKTGTLTTGRLSVDRVITEFAVFKNPDSMKAYPRHRELLSLCAHLNTESSLSEGGVKGGNSTDKALLEFMAAYPPEESDVKSKTPFTSDIKYSSVTLKNGKTVIKGAAEIIISSCRFAYNERGEAVASELQEVKRELKCAVGRGERAIAVAVYEGEERDKMTFLSLVILKDKIRSGVKESVSSLIKAGIQIVMVTGDGKDTALTIAEECGFYKSGCGHVALSSEELNALEDDEVKAILPRLRVLSRALPRDKSRLVRLAEESELVSGMTGDGVNDAPSLKLADVGFAMGSGTDIAKSAADVVILDDSISSIEKTVLYGRTIFKSIRKFITFQLIMNLAACGITLVGQILGIDSPITIIQMLWVNIIMDTLGGLAFAGEPPLRYYMKEKPKRRDESILNGQMIKHILSNGIFTLGLLVIFLRLDFFKNIYIGSGGHLTAFYALFIFSGLFNCLGARSERIWIFKNIRKNRPFVFIMLLIALIQIFIIYFGGSLFRSTPLSAGELLWAVMIALSVLVFDLIRRVAVKLK